MREEKNLTVIIPAEHAGLRLDKSLATLFPQYSRAKIQAWIQFNKVSVDGEPQAGRYHVRGGEEVFLTPVLEDQNRQHRGQDIPIDILFEDEHILVINKPAGLVVHPGAGNPQGTLLNALLHRYPGQSQLPRAGIVHRLDKDTSGIMLAAKSLQGHAGLTRLLQNREVDRRYHAIIRGQLISGGTIDTPIGRHAYHRTKMAVNQRGKPACTHYKIVEKFKCHTWVEAKLETGRTHQIRVHFSSVNHPLVGDQLYAPRISRVAKVPQELNEMLCNFPRQALHACRLALRHPVSGQELSWVVDMPEDMQVLLQNLRAHTPL